MNLVKIFAVTCRASPNLTWYQNIGSRDLALRGRNAMVDGLRMVLRVGS